MFIGGLSWQTSPGNCQFYFIRIISIIIIIAIGRIVLLIFTIKQKHVRALPIILQYECIIVIGTHCNYQTDG